MTATVDQVRARQSIRLAGPRLGDPRMLVAAVVVSTQVLGQVSLGFDLSIAQILVAVATCVAVDVSAQLLRGDRTIAWPASAMLTGNGVALILRVPGTEHGDWWSLRGWWVFASVALLAMASKHLVRVRGGHVFNPSNIALVLGFLVLPESMADPQDLWWGPPGFGLWLTYAIIIVGGIVASRRLGLWDIVLTYFITWGSLVALLAATGKCMTARWSLGPVCGIEYFQAVVLSPEILIFALFMITDPATTPRGRRSRIWFSTITACTSALLVGLVSTEYSTKVAILAGLAVACALRAAIRLAETRTGSGVPLSRARHAAALPAVVLAVALLAIATNTGAIEVESDPSLESIRSTVDLDRSALPEVDLDPEVRQVAASLEGEVAGDMLFDLAVDLELAAAAIESGNAEFARAAGVGPWLDDLLDVVSDPTAADPPRYEFESATLVVLGDRLSPQSLPPLALEVTGTERVGDLAPTDFAGTFTMSLEDGHFLVSADDREGEIDPGIVGVDGVPIEVFERALRVGSGVDEGSVAGQVPLFEDVTEEAGVSMRTGSATLDEIPVPSAATAEAMVDSVPVWTALMNSQTYFGSGQAWGDADGDGHVDLYLTNQAGPNALFLNEGDGSFEEAPESLSGAALLPDEQSGGATWVDYDNDGWSDLHVLSSEGSRLFRNVGGETLEDVTDAAGIAGGGKGMTASWADFDGDADLDVYVANYGCQPCHPNNAPPVSDDQRDQDQLFENLGDGTFADRTDWISHMPATKGLAFAATWIDYDADGLMDLYVLNDVRDDQGSSDVMTGRVTGDGTTPGNLMIHNDGPGCGGWCFSDATTASGTERRANAMGVATADYDGDGLEDIFFTNGGFSAGPTGLLRNRGDGTFEETAPERNAHLGEWSWGASPIDVDNDGDRDIFVSVGYSDVLQQLPNSALTDELLADAPSARERALTDGTARTPWGYVDPPWPVAEDPERRTDQNRVLLQDSTGAFRVASVGDAGGLSRVHYGNATADFDGDGRLDVVVGNLGDGYSLLRNRAPEASSAGSVLVDVAGDGKRVSTDAVGTRVAVLDTAGREQVAWVRIGDSLGSGSDRRLHFGLGDADVARVEVTWPDGSTSVGDADEASLDTDSVISVTTDGSFSSRPFGASG